MKISNLPALLLFCVLSFYSCEPERDTYNLTITNPYSHQIWVTSNSFSPVQMDSRSTEVVEGNAYSEVSLTASEDELGEETRTILGKDWAVFSPEPDLDYEWTAGETEVYLLGSRGNPGGGVDCTNDNYNGPDVDAQLDALCNVAFLYDCAGEEEAKKMACDEYYEYGSAVWTGSGSLPDCQYCD